MKKLSNKMPISFLRLDFTKSLLLFSSLIFFVGISIFGLRQLYSQAKLSSANLDEASLAAKLEEDESATVSGELASSRSAGRFEGTSASGSGKEVNKKAESEKKLFSLSLPFLNKTKEQAKSTPSPISTAPVQFAPAGQRGGSTRGGSPTIISIVPNKGPLSGGQTITITGTDLKSAACKQTSAGYYHTCAIDTAGVAYCWGYNGQGQLGNGTNMNTNKPVAVDASGVLAGKTLTKITTDYFHACAIDTAGAAYCWGSNVQGQLGNGNNMNTNKPVAVDASGVLAGKTLTQIVTGYSHVCALDTAGAAYCWGSNGQGQLGNGTNMNTNKPTAVDASGVLAGKTLTQIVTGYSHACALDTAGAAYCWGNNNNGQLGNGTNMNTNKPVAVDTNGVLAGKTLAQITAGREHTCAIDTAGAAYCWGSNNNGQLGDGTNMNTNKPTAVDASGVLAGKTLTQIVTDQQHTCAIDTAGAAYCWGNNNNGQLGDGTTTNSSLPLAVNTNAIVAGNSITQISTGFYHTCAIDTVGVAYCWGYNVQGQLGNGNNTNSNAPVAVFSSSTTVTINGKACTNVVVNETGTQLTCTVPASATVGAYDVVVSHNSGSSTSVQGYTYQFPCNVENCDVCNPENICTTCITDYNLTNSNTCIQCTGATVWNPTTKVCDNCPTNCTTCSNATTCTACSVGYHLNSANQCELDCNISNCQQCSAPNQCQTCNNGYYLKNNQCLSCSSLPHCITCSSENTCTTCESGYHLNSANQCELDCNISNCQQCSAPNQCQTCQSGYYLDGNQCLSCDSISNCIACSNAYTCTTCATGYHLNSANQCELDCNISNCQQCSAPNQCQTCNNGYYLKNNQCLSCSSLPHCITCSSENTCTTCESGYHLNSANQCELDCNISNCQQCSAPNQCQTCQSGYYLDGNQCLSCDSISNCIACSNAYTCTTCNIGYHLNSANQCELDCNISNCQQCSAPNVCQTCQSGYYLDGNQCKTCAGIANCLSCSNAYTCTNCKPGYHLNVSNQCDPDCSIANCTNCPAPNQCNSCAPGYYLDSNECKACNLTNCNECSNATTCTSCEAGYHLDPNNQCVMDCNINNCTTCSAPNICQTCQDSYYLKNNQCVACSSLPNCVTCTNDNTCTTCATGYHVNSANQCELDCNIANCNQCSAPNVCQTCQPGFQLNSSNQCVDSSLPFYNFSLTKVVNPAATQAHNLFSFVLEKLTLDASNQEIVDNSFTAQTISLADNQTHLFNNLPKGKYRLTEYLFPFWKVTGAHNLEQDSNYQPHDLVSTYTFSLNSLNTYINQSTLTATINHEFSGLNAINLQISGGAQSWFSELRQSEIKAIANQLTGLPLAKVSYQLDTPYLSSANTSPLGNVCGSGTSLPIDNFNPYLGGGVVNNLPSPVEGKHILYACASIKHAATSSNNDGEVAIIKADFWYDATPLTCSFHSHPQAGSQPHTAIFTVSCIDPGYPTTGSGPCPTVAPANPNDACRDDYLNNYSCQTDSTPNSTCSISVRDYAGNITNLVSPGNPFGQVAPTPTPTPTPTSTPTTTLGCTAGAPGNLAPFIYRVERLSASKIKLFFTPGSRPFTHYQLSYGYAGQGFSFGAQIDDPSKGEVEIDYLTANASYQFQLLPVNDCATGTWSNLFPVTLVAQPNVVLTKAQLSSNLSSGALTPLATPTTPTSTPASTPAPTSTHTAALASGVLESVSANYWSYLAYSLLPLALLALLLPSKRGLLFNQETKEPLSGATLIVEKDGKVYEKRTTNSFGVYSSFKLSSGKYLLKVIKANYQFPYHPEHKRLNLITSYYPQEIVVNSKLGQLFAPKLSMTKVNHPSSGKDSQFTHQLLSCLLNLEQLLWYCQPIIFALALALLISNPTPLNWCLMIVSILVALKRVVIRLL